MSETKLVNKKWIFVKRPEKEISPDCFKYVEEPFTPALEEGQVLLQALYISVDPYMRIHMSKVDSWQPPQPLDSVQGGHVVAKVLQSRDKNIRVGEAVMSLTGWQLYAVAKASEVYQLAMETDPQTHQPIFPLSFYLGVLGLPGITAYFALLEVGKPKEGETVVVSAAAGAVGSIVVQIAKMKGCRVIGVAGSDEKCRNVVSDLGADACINYHTHPNMESMLEALKEACPNGVDLYFDNTGGYTTDAVFDIINVRARIVVCGQISVYNQLDKPDMGPRFLHKVIFKRATIQGVLAVDYFPRMQEMQVEMIKWLKEGKIKYRETLVAGFENLPKALNALFHGANVGKLVVQV